MLLNQKTRQLQKEHELVKQLAAEVERLKVGATHNARVMYEGRGGGLGVEPTKRNQQGCSACAAIVCSSAVQCLRGWTIWSNPLVPAG